MRTSKALSRCKSFYDDRRGTVAVMMGFLLPIFIGFLGLAVDVPNWYLSQRKAQTAVDAGAISAAYNLYYNDNTYEAEYAAADGAKRNAFVAGSGRTLTVNIPPLSGPYAGDDAAVEVIGTELQTVFLASVIMDDKVEIQVRAVARAAQTASDTCVLGLDGQAPGTVWFSGSSSMNMDCDVHSNSSDPESILAGGSASGIVNNLSSVGQIDLGDNTSIDVNGSQNTYMLPIKDPYGPDGVDLIVPSSPVGCDYNSLKVFKETVTLTPGRYCGGINISNDSHVTFDQGIYIVDGGRFEIGAQSSMVGEEVTFVLTGSGSDYATVFFNGNAVIDLVAPSSGPFEGVLIFQDPNAGAAAGGNKTYQNKFNGGTDVRLVGALYFPNQEIWFQGGTSIADSCIQIVARTVVFNGNGALGKNNCPNNMQLADIKVTRIKLVE